MIKKGLLIIIIFLFFIYVISFNNTNCYAANNYEEVSSPSSNGAFFNNLNFINNKIADPQILKENDTYYVYGTGLKILKSKDFKKWTTVTSRAIALESIYEKYWAPEVYKYNNKFYMFYTGVNSTKGIRDILVAVSDSPEGPFTKKAKINSKVNMPIDPNVLFDGNKVYLYTKSEIGDSGKCCNGVGTSIYVEELNSDLLSIKKGSNPTKVLTFDKNSPSWEKNFVEGNFIFKENGKYYLMYSTGSFSKGTYAVGYAISSNPEGPFKRVVTSIPLLYGKKLSSTFDSTKYIYSTGHNSIIKLSDDERYIVYHSNIYENNEYVTRKLTIDYLGFDANGKLFVNGPSTIDQPLPSGSNGIYKISIDKYTIKNNNKDVKTLHDNINYNVLNTANSFNKDTYVSYKETKTSSITIDQNSNYTVEDIWLFGTSSGFNNTKANIIINNKYIIKSFKLGKNKTIKIQMPELNEIIKSVTINFTEEITVSEVSLYLLVIIISLLVMLMEMVKLKQRIIY